MAGIYIHLPFCRSKCRYCDFTTIAHGETHVKSYVERLLRELDEETTHASFHTLYLGGGTPSFLSDSDLFLIIRKTIARYGPIEGEITMEVNMEDVTLERARTWRAMGVNRLSVGMQTNHAHLLERIGRRGGNIEEVVAIVREAGFRNFSVDMMLALPGETIDEAVRDAEILARLEVPHISAYSLILEEGTYFSYLEKKGKLTLPDEDAEREAFHRVRDFLKDAGYHHYEISSFARPGYEAVHNTSYWTREPYLGFGIGSASFWKSIRYTTTRSLARYLKGTRQENFVEVEELSRGDAVSEAFILGLRLLDGVDTEKIFRIYPEMRSRFEKIIQKNIQKNLLERHGNVIHLTKRGQDLADLVNVDLMP